jgi:hypothetical protein
MKESRRSNDEQGGLGRQVAGGGDLAGGGFGKAGRQRL